MTRSSKCTPTGTSRRMFTPGLVGTLAGLLLMPLALAGAQGTLSGLGFGYPVGGLSTRAGATGGAFGEFDAVSTRNPAALGGLPRTLMAAQTEPEYRTLRIGNVKESTTTQRVPLLLVAFPARNRVAVAFSATTFLDRSYSTATTGSVVIDGNTLLTNDRTDVRGSIGDLRAAVGWRVNDRLSVGVAGHLFTGDNLVATSREFADTTSFGSVTDSSRVEFFGRAISVGAEVQVVKGLAASASYRAGGKLESRVTDTVRSRANVPDRLGVALRYDAVPGAIFAVGLEQQRWSDMQGLGSSLVQTHDATNWHAGAEIAGPRFMGSVVQLRAGYAQGTLPFGADDRRVQESRITGGFGLPLARDFASLDFSVQRALRSLAGGAGRESAWLLGVGIQIRPGGP
jgi:opacity protein-like surface antigen